MRKRLPQILLIDDDESLCHLLMEYLEAEGMRVVTVHDGEMGCQEALGGCFDLVVLDVMLPGMSGIEVLRQLRHETDQPVLMLTGRGDDLDRILGLELGADDYLAKPCNPRELVARIHAILRRTGLARRGEAHGQSALPLTISQAKRVATWRGEALQLTSTEFSILSVLFENAGSVVSKSELSLQVLARPLTRYDRSLDMHVSNLRRKLGKLEDGRMPLQTVHGSGFVLLRE
ncbi:response regulator [Rhodocyclaceae bacterium SMB388]